MDPLAIGHSRLFQRGSRDFAKQRNRTQSAAMRISGAIDFNAPVLNYARKDFPLLEADASVEKALEAIRREGIGERVIYFYAIDERKHLVGVVPTRRLLTAAPNTLLREIMVPRVITLPAEATVLRHANFSCSTNFSHFRLWMLGVA